MTPEQLDRILTPLSRDGVRATTISMSEREFHGLIGQTTRDAFGAYLFRSVPINVDLDRSSAGERIVTIETVSLDPDDLGLYRTGTYQFVILPDGTLNPYNRPPALLRRILPNGALTTFSVPRPIRQEEETEPPLPSPHVLERKLESIRDHVRYTQHREFVLQLGYADGDERYMVSCEPPTQCSFVVEAYGREVAASGRLELATLEGWAALVESAKLERPVETKPWWVRLLADESDPFI